MTVIYKYPLMLGSGGYKVSLPKDAIIIDVGIQDGQGTLWAIVEPGPKHEDRTIVAVWTGEPFNYKYGMVHIKSFEHDGLVWHIFEDCR